jgi:2',3'-cyclic-nucleotide 2'-phosphodiesterase (5'-nucleotidase family)
MNKFFFSFLGSLLLLFACQSTQPTTAEKASEGTMMAPSPPRAEAAILHLNDVYEISPLSGGKEAGMARVATLRKQLLSTYGRVYTVMAGDFLSPSGIGTAKYRGKRIQGAQMVDVMNEVGFNFVTFGNHEFDLKEKDLQARINESDFEWISSNTFHREGQRVSPFFKVKDGINSPIQPYKIVGLPSTSGSMIRMGIIGVCLPFNKQPYVAYRDIYQEARNTYNYLQDKTDFVVALTHLSIEMDRELAQKVPELALIMGGHEHENHYEEVGKVIIAKADANAKTVYLHRILFEERNWEVEIESQLIPLDSTVAFDPEVEGVVKKWEKRANDGFASLGLNMKEEVTTLKEPLEGREAIIRMSQTNMGEVVTGAMLKAIPGCDLALVNSGSIRIDDIVFGTLTQYDVIRMLPFGGSIMKVEMKGSLLGEILDTGLGRNRGKGGYLQVARVERKDKSFLINGKPLDPEATYQVAISSFLMSGREENLEFLKKKNPGVVKAYPAAKEGPASDIRLAVIDYLKSKK